MGYELSINRSDPNKKILIDEWTRYIEKDDEFEFIDKYSISLEDDSILSVNTPYAGLWKAEGREVPFTFNEGRGSIEVKNPDVIITKKMFQIANDLGAIVEGEEGELYGADGKAIKKKDETKWKLKFWPFFSKKKELQETKESHDYNSFATLAVTFEGTNNPALFTCINEFICDLSVYGFNTDSIEVTEDNSFKYSTYIESINLEEVKSGLIISDNDSPEVIFYHNRKNGNVSMSLKFEFSEERMNKLVNAIIGIGNIIFMTLYSSYDESWQSQEQLIFYEANGKSTEGLEFYTDEFGDTSIDVSNNPGRYFFANGLGIVAGWKMWFGKEFPLCSIGELEKSNIFIKKIVQSDLLEVQLLETLIDLDYSKNRTNQRKFLQLIGINS